MIVLTVQSADHDRVRLSGWVTPAGSYQVQLRSAGGHQEVGTDGRGAFGFDSVPHGLVRLVLVPVDPVATAGPAPLIKPSLII